VVEGHVVTALHVTDADKEYVDLTVSTPEGTKVVRTTVHHPFYNASTREWTDAEQLHAGEELSTPGNGRALLTSTSRFTAKLRTYNLTIERVHTYYVLAGNTPVLVHNANCGEIVNHFDGYSAARSAARKSAGLGDDAVPFVQELGPWKGRVTGMQSPDGMRGWRIDFDPKNAEKGFHVNWWVKNSPKRSDGWKSGANVIRGGTDQDYWAIMQNLPHT
jgi:hypothetical protein